MGRQRFDHSAALRPANVFKPAGPVECGCNTLGQGESGVDPEIIGVFFDLLLEIKTAMRRVAFVDEPGGASQDLRETQGDMAGALHLAQFPPPCASRRLENLREISRKGQFAEVIESHQPRSGASDNNGAGRLGYSRQLIQHERVAVVERVVDDNERVGLATERNEFLAELSE